MTICGETLTTPASLEESVTTCAPRDAASRYTVPRPLVPPRLPGGANAILDSPAGAAGTTVLGAVVTAS